MGIKEIFRRSEQLVSIDVGSTGVKVIELDTSLEHPRLVNIAYAPLGGEIFTNNVLQRGEVVSEKISSLIDANNMAEKRIAVAMPGPTVFTKKIKMPRVPLSEMRSAVQFEAGSFIPHNIDAVKIDYHVLGESGKNQLDVLVVAVKDEIVNSFVDCLTLSGLEVAVVDVDYYALQNCFELACPGMVNDTVALINMGARYSSINIVKSGQSLFTGDVAVGGKMFSDAIAEGLGVPFERAELLKREQDHNGSEYSVMSDIIDRKLEYVASEFNRQLSLFWNASGADEGISRIVITGGGSQIPGLLQELSEKTGIQCEAFNPLNAVSCGTGFDSGYLKELAPLMAICIGMGIRQPGDKQETWA